MASSPGDSDTLHPEEDRLIRGAQEGDRLAFARLVGQYYDRLYRWLYHLAGDSHAAEDLTQETFLKAFAHLAKFRAGSNFRAWLYRIAHNNFVNQRRSRSSQRRGLPEDLPADDEGPVEQLIQDEERALLAQAVKQLPADFRAALLLRIEEGLSFRQIASILGLTEETARWRVFKARQKLLSAVGGQQSAVSPPPERSG